MKHDKKGASRALSSLPLLSWGVLAAVGLGSAWWVTHLGAGPNAEQLRQSRARDDIRVLKTALLTALPEGQSMPDTQAGLRALKDWGVLPSVPRDPWGREYVYRYPAPGREFELFSLGPDGVESPDDIVHWNLYGGR